MDTLESLLTAERLYGGDMQSKWRKHHRNNELEVLK